MNDLKKEDQEKIEILINSIVNKVLHSPVSGDE